jgi:hypothetical protein
MGTPLDSAQFVRLLDKRLREVGENKFNDLPSQIPTYFRVLPSDSAWEEFYNVGSVPDIPEFNGKLSTLGISPGYHLKLEPKEYGAMLQAERKLIDDKKYAVLDSRASGLMTAAHRTREKMGARPFNYAFSSAFDFMTSEEGLSLCNSSHTTKSGTSTSSGFDNSGTSALSKTSLAAAWLAMRGFRDDISERIEMSDNYWVVVPDALGDTADEIVGTPKGLNTTEGNINPQQGRYTVKRNLRLDDYDSNNWFLVNVDLMKQALLWIDRIKPETKNTVDFDTYMLKTAVYFRCAYGWNDWRWIYGQVV